jgi:mandelate racemase
MSATRLTIREVRATPVLVPMRRALGTSVMQVKEAPLLLIDVLTEEGISGCGYLFCYLPAAAPAAAALVRDAHQLLAGSNAAPAAVRRALDARFRLIGARGLTSMVAAGLDMACWDALAKAAGLPLVTLLGGEPRPIPAYNSNGLGLLAPQAAADEALELAAEGFRAVKMRLGRDSGAQDLAAVRAVRNVLPADVLLMSDYNQALSPAAARERCRQLDDEGLFWIEEPVRHDDYPTSAALCEQLSTPVQLGENFAGPRAMARALALHAADLVMPDLERIGGVSGWMEAAGLAHAAGVEMSSHLFPEVSVHLLAATPTAHWLEYVDWADAILQEPLRVSDGCIQPSRRPGNGLAWDTEAVEQYRIG